MRGSELTECNEQSGSALTHSLTHSLTHPLTHHKYHSVQFVYGIHNVHVQCHSVILLCTLYITYISWRTSHEYVSIEGRKSIVRRSSFVKSFLRSFVPSFLSFLRSFVPSFLRSFVPSFLRRSSFVGVSSSFIAVAVVRFCCGRRGLSVGLAESCLSVVSKAVDNTLDALRTCTSQVINPANNTRFVGVKGI